MGRIRRFEDHRFVGARDTMVVYDCDDESEQQILSDRIATDDLIGLNLLQTFGPDELSEARNRGFRPY